MPRAVLYHAGGAFVTLLVLAASGGCRQPQAAPAAAEPRPVRVVRLETAPLQQWSLAGAVRARYETPLAFRIGGQILRRHVQAGERVEQNALLFELDPRDVEQLEQAAAAQARAAAAEAENAERERQRVAALLEQQVASQQQYDLAATLAASARERWAAARAQREYAQQQRDYTRLLAPHAGTVVEVTGEPGQVVGPGQPVAMLAQDGPREIEVYVPENRVRALPARAEAVFSDGRTSPAELREIAGSAEPLTRTWRARFRLVEADSNSVALGATARLVFAADSSQQKRVPLSAVYDGGSGTVVWQVRDGVVQPVPVTVVSTDGENAYLETAVEAGSLVVAAGTHLLQPGERVRPLP